MSQTTAVAAKVVGQRIMLGQTYHVFEFPNGVELPIRRMGMKSELLFVDLYDKFVGVIKGAQVEVMDMLKAYMMGATSKTLGPVEGLEMVGNLLQQVPALQDFAVEAIQTVVTAQSVDIPRETLETLSTIDCFEILSAQAEVQGLLSTFRGLAQGLGTARN